MNRRQAARRAAGAKGPARGHGRSTPRLASPRGRSLRAGAHHPSSVIAFALALQLAVAVPAIPQPPPVDRGPFDAGELAASGLGALAGDLAVVGAGWGTLQLFAKGAIAPDAHNFRNAAFTLLGAAVVVPPLTAALLGYAARSRPTSGAFWKAYGLAMAGQAAALGAFYLSARSGLGFSPVQLWTFLPLQVISLAVGTSVGLHWGPRAPAAAIAPAPAPPPPDAPRLSAVAFPTCPDG